MRSSGSFPPATGSSPRLSRPLSAPVDVDEFDEDGAPQKATLSRELSDFLVEFSIAMQKHAIYPPKHPLLQTAVDGVMRKVALLLVDRESLSIGIARRQLIIEGVGTDPEHPLLKELAGRLHKHNLGAIKFGQGVARDELTDALATIAVDAGGPAGPIGGKADELSEQWANVKLFPLNYERLELVYEGTDTEGEERIKKGAGNPRAAQLWVGMARAAMMMDEGAELDADSMNPLVVAEAIDKKRDEQAYDQVIVGYLLQIAEELKKSGGTPETVELQKRISDLVKQLSQDTLKNLLRMGGDAAQRRQFLLNASQGMTVDAVLDLVQATAADGKQSISHSMMRLFSKLSKYADNDADPMRRANAEASMREHMQKLISEWKLDDPNPTAYGKALAKAARTGRRKEPDNPYIECEPERIAHMAFELSASGPRLDAALDAMLNAARLELLLNMLDNAPDKEFAEGVWAYLDSKDILWAALSEARIDFAVLERLVRRKRMSAVDPILDVTERTRDARVRERLMDVLLEIGDEVGPFLVRRLDGAKSDLRRDMFQVLGKLKSVPDGFDGSRFLTHPDVAIRREAVRLMLKFVETRDDAIVAGITDTDERAVFFGLQAAQESGCPPRALPIIRKRLENGDMDTSLMTLAIRVIAAADSGVGPQLQGKGRTSQIMKAVNLDANPAQTAIAGKKTLDWLIGKVASKNIFGKWKLEKKTPEMLAAFGAIAGYWNHLPEVQDIIQVAIKANDPELKKAIGTTRVTGKFKAITD